MTFSALGLREALLRAISEQAYDAPTPIQAQAIPAVLRGVDLLAGAQTGTGKTAGFTLPILQLLADGARQPGPRALILTPTRELAAQVEESVRVYGKYLRLKSTVIFGGVGMQPQIQTLQKGVDILVATPGRLLDLLQQKALNLDYVEILVLDEADRMLDMGFIRDIKRVLAVLPAKRQNLLFSATFSDEIRSLAAGLLRAPEMIDVAPRNATAAVVQQIIHPVDRDKKHAMLAHLIKSRDWRQVLVFTRTKHGANRLVEQLARDGIEGAALHGNKSQSARTRALSGFKDGSVRVLVATDIAARGIDIDQLPQVVNYDLPNVPQDYVHRIGRTGRAGASGCAVSLVCVDEAHLLKDIEKLIRQTLPQEVLSGFEPDRNATPQPIQLRSNERRQGQNSGRSKAPAKAAPAQNAAPLKGANGGPAGGRTGAPNKAHPGPQPARPAPKAGTASHPKPGVHGAKRAAGGGTPVPAVQQNGKPQERKRAPQSARATHTSSVQPALTARKPALAALLQSETRLPKHAAKKA
ncbi:DEAD/DEAH box helicase [Massilia sp. W12]|uniref:DEAD/DEAH box helicase n=1 Tax=Massilia sp. W12 TaxID=3126507 RepID=UPI0030D5DC7B